MLIFVCPKVSELRFYGCCHTCFINVLLGEKKVEAYQWNSCDKGGRKTSKTSIGCPAVSS